MCRNSDQYERVCKGEFASVHTKLDRMDEAIRGNGKPGIQIRLDRLETAAAKRNKVLWMVLGSVVTLAVAAVWRLVVGA
jgi:hypothetical protein